MSAEVAEYNQKVSTPKGCIMKVFPAIKSVLSSLHILANKNAP